MPHLRHLIARAALVLAPFWLLMPAAAKVPPEKLAVQLYSLHADLRRDLGETLARVRDMGLQQVELYPMPGMDAARWQAALKAADLKAVGAHVPLADLDADLEGVIADARLLGLSYVGVAWIKPNKAPLSTADIDAVADIYNRACPRLQAAGIGLMYHIHGYELAGIETGSSLFDRLMAKTDPACVTVELDVFWAVKAGTDPLSLLQRYPDRIRMLHMKDIRTGAARSTDGTADRGDFVPVGSGSIDWPALLAASGNVDWFVLEDESANAATHLQRSFNYLTAP